MPIYLGSPGYQKRIPRETYIDYSDFKTLADLERYLVSMTEAEHARYLDAIDRFVRSPNFLYFSADRFAITVGEKLGLVRKGTPN